MRTHKPTNELRKLAQCNIMGGHCVVSGSIAQDDLFRWGTLRDYDFHHINPKRKSKNYENLKKRELCSPEMLEEIGKCVLVKNNYHQIIEAQQINGVIRWSTGIEVPFHSGIIDPKREFGWFANIFLDSADLKRLIPRDYVVTKGKKSYTLNENKFECHLLEEMHALQIGEHWQVRESTGNLVLLDIQKTDTNHVVWKLDGAFDLFTWKLEAKYNTYYIHKGIVVDRYWRVYYDKNFTLSARLELFPTQSANKETFAEQCP